MQSELNLVHGVSDAGFSKKGRIRYDGSRKDQFYSQNRSVLDKDSPDLIQIQHPQIVKETSAGLNGV